MPGGRHSASVDIGPIIAPPRRRTGPPAPGSIVGMTTRRTRVGGYVLCLEGGRLLMCRIASGEAAAGRWTLPGGGVRFGEEPANAARREVEEETGLLVELDDLAIVLSRVIPPSASTLGDAVHAVSIVYRGHVVGGELRPEPEGSTDAAAWLTGPEARSLPLVPLGEAAVELAFDRPTGA